MLSREELRAAILGVEDLVRTPVGTPEWGPAIDGQVYVRTLSVGARWQYLRSLKPLIASDADLTDEGLVRESGVVLAAHTLCDADGAILFTPGDVDALAQKSWTAMTRVISAAADLNGLSAKAVEDTKKNLPAETAIAASSTA